MYKFLTIITINICTVSSLIYIKSNNNTWIVCTFLITGSSTNTRPHNPIFLSLSELLRSQFAQMSASQKIYLFQKKFPVFIDAADTVSLPSTYSFRSEWFFLLPIQYSLRKVLGAVSSRPVSAAPTPNVVSSILFFCSGTKLLPETNNWTFIGWKRCLFFKLWLNCIKLFNIDSNRVVKWMGDTVNKG